MMALCKQEDRFHCWSNMVGFAGKETPIYFLKTLKNSLQGTYTYILSVEFELQSCQIWYQGCSTTRTVMLSLSLLCFNFTYHFWFFPEFPKFSTHSSSFYSMSSSMIPTNIIRIFIVSVIIVMMSKIHTIAS